MFYGGDNLFNKVHSLHLLLEKLNTKSQHFGWKVGMGDIDILAYNYCKEKNITIITIIELTVFVLKNV